MRRRRARHRHSIQSVVGCCWPSLARAPRCLCRNACSLHRNSTLSINGMKLNGKYSAAMEYMWIPHVLWPIILMRMLNRVNYCCTFVFSFVCPKLDQSTRRLIACFSRVWSPRPYVVFICSAFCERDVNEVNAKVFFFSLRVFRLHWTKSLCSAIVWSIGLVLLFRLIPNRRFSFVSLIAKIVRWADGRSTQFI